MQISSLQSLCALLSFLLPDVYFATLTCLPSAVAHEGQLNNLRLERLDARLQEGLSVLFKNLAMHGLAPLQV